MRILVAEDDKGFSRQLSEYLERFAKENGFSVYISIFENGAQLVDEYRPDWDLLLLDVDMPGLDGFSVASSIREMDPQVAIIFITNLAQFAIRGYEVQALDYMVKPISYPALSMKLKREMGQICHPAEKTLLIPQRSGVVRLSVSRLLYVEVYNHCLRYHTSDEVVETTGAKSLSKVEQELAGDGFFRCHVSFLVNLRHVRGMGENTVKVGDEVLPISRHKKKAFLEALIEQVKGEGR